jgi:internalin A
LRELAELKALHSLSLGNTKLTNEGLKEIAAVTSLTDLSLNQTQVTEAGIREFQEAFPKCMIFK